MSYVVNEEPLDKGQYPYYRFSENEYNRRHRVIREFMAERKLECLLVTGEAAVWDRCWANIVYVMNWMGTMEMPAYCVFPKEGEPVVTCLGLNAGHPDRIARITVGKAYGGPDAAAIAAERVRELGIKSGRIGLVEPDTISGIPVNHMKTLTRELPQVEFVSVTRDWWLMRLAKSPEEVAVLEEIARWSDLAHRDLALAIRPGVTERDLFCTVYNTVYRLGADHPSMLLIGTGPMDRPYANFVRNRPVDRILQRGDIVSTELGPRHPTGYEAQVGHIFTIGPATPRFREMFAAAAETHDRLRDVCRAGNSEYDIWEASREFREKNFNPKNPMTCNYALVHGMFGVPNDMHRNPPRQAPKEKVPFVPYQLLTVEVHAETPGKAGAIYLVKPYLVMPEGPPKALSQLPLEMTEL